VLSIWRRLVQLDDNWWIKCELAGWARAGGRKRIRNQWTGYGSLGSRRATALEGPEEGSRTEHPLCFRKPAHTVQLGQSTSYVTLDSLAILTDPALSDRTIPSRLAPQRLRPAPCTLDELRRVDVVLVSHKWVWVGGRDFSSAAGTLLGRVLLGHLLLEYLLLGISRQH
jgi:hypothetical protein